MDSMLKELLKKLDKAYPNSINSHYLNSDGITDRVIIDAYEGDLIKSWQKVEIQDSITGKLAGSGTDFSITPKGAEFLRNIKIASEPATYRRDEIHKTLSDNSLLSNNTLENNFIKFDFRSMKLNFDFLGKERSLASERLGAIVIITIAVLYVVIQTPSSWLTCLTAWGIIVVGIVLSSPEQSHKIKVPE